MNELAPKQPTDSGLRELALFAGAGGGILGGKILGWRTVCAVELDAYARKILLARQDDGTLDPFPVWDDIRTFDGTPWAGRVDVISGGFPCVDISCAGKGAGIEGERSGLWREMARIIREVGPRFVFVENSPVLTSRGLGVVLGDLASMGYDAAWCVLGACHAGAPHKRERIWILARNANGADERTERCFCQRQGAHASGVCETMADSDRLREPQQEGSECDERRRSGDCGEVAEFDRERPWLRCIECGRRHYGDTGDFCPACFLAYTDGSLRQRRADIAQRHPQGGTAAGGCGEDVADADEIGRLRRAGESGEQDGRGQSEDSRSLPCWQPCQCCDDFWCNIHESHTAECECPEIDEWGDVDPYSHTVGERLEGIVEGGTAEGATDRPCHGCDPTWWQSEPHMDGMVDGLAAVLDIHGAAAAGDVGRVATRIPNRNARLRCIGNGQVPACAAMAWRILTGILK